MKTLFITAIAEAVVKFGALELPPTGLEPSGFTPLHKVLIGAAVIVALFLVSRKRKRRNRR